MSKRFTDTKKWRNMWFRALPLKAKVVWSFLCDECEYYGVWREDYDVASVQVAFSFNQTDLKNWFGDKVYFFDSDKVLIVPFFEFQYGDVKDSWNAKVNARKKLESLGFSIVENKVKNPHSGDSQVTVDDSPQTHLIKVKDNIKVKVKEGGVGETFKPTDTQIEEIYKIYPRKEGKSKGFASARSQIKTQQDLDDLRVAVERYSEHVKRNRTESNYIKHFSTFMNSWQDPLDPDFGKTVNTEPSIEERLAKLSEDEAKNAG